MDELVFTTFDVAKILRIDRTCLQEWINGGYVVPTKLSSGRGDKTLFSMNDMCRLGVFIYMRNLGIPRSFCSDVVRWSKRRVIR